VIEPHHILVDECVPRRFMRRHLADLAISHALDQGWGGRHNGVLLALMKNAGFRILVTVDRNLVYQQNVGAAGIAVIVLHATSNRTDDLAPLVPALRIALAQIRPGEIVRLGV